MKNNKKIIVAQIMGKWVGGGVEAVIMNYYRNIDKSKIQFDFICDEDSTNIPYEEIKAMGGRIIICPPYQKIFKYIKELKKIFKENDYKIVHSNINALSVFPLYAAKKAGVPVRIAHSHSTSNKIEWKKNIIKTILKPFSKLFSTDYFSCTEHAGRWLFGDKAYDSNKVFVVNNGILIEDYIFNSKIRAELRKEMGYTENDIVIGHIGRFMKQKNHDFIIDLFKELYGENPNYKLMLIGQGPLQDDIKTKVSNYGLDKVVLFLGQRNDVNKYYQAMDLFLFPSIYEGLGMVMIEAQVSGLNCIASTEVPAIAKVSDKVEFIDLKKPIDYWKNEIIKTKLVDRTSKIEKVKQLGFDIKVESKKLEDKYIRLILNK